MEAYQAALNDAPGVRVEAGARRTKPGTINACIVAFYQSYAFMKNKPITRSTDRNILEAFRIKHGDKHAATIERKHGPAAVKVLP